MEFNASKLKKVEEKLENTEERLKVIIDSSDDLMTIYDYHANTLLWANQNWKKILGYTPKDLENPLELIHIEDRQRVVKAFQEIDEKDSIQNLEFRYKTSGGEYKYFQSTLSKIILSGKKVVYTRGHEITKRKKLKEALQKSEERFRSILQNAPDFIMIVDHEARIQYVNRAFPNMVMEDLIWKTLYDYTQAEYHEDFKEGLSRVFKTGQTVNLIVKGSKDRWYENRIGPIKYGDQVVAVEIISRDITDRKKNEDTLKSSEKRYRRLLESISEGVYALNQELRYILVNDEAARRAQIPKEKMMGRKITDLFPGHEKTVFFKVNKQVMETGKPAIASSEFTFPDGRKGWYEVHVYPVPEGILCISTDITERKKVEESLRESEIRFRELADLLPVGIYEIDLEQNVMYVNRRGLELYGYTQEDLENGLKTSDMMVPEDFPRALKVRPKLLSDEARVGFEYTALRKDGSTFQVYTQTDVIMRGGELVGLRGIVMNITDQKRAEEEIGNLAKFPSENPNPVLRIRKDGVILYANYASESWLEKWKSKIGKSAPKRWIKHITDVLNSGKSKEVEYKHENRIFSFIFTPIVDSGYVNVYGRDITERKIAEEEIDVERHKFNQSIEAAMDMMGLTDLNGNLTYVNKAFERITGYISEELVGKTLTLVQPKDQLSLAQTKFREIIENGSVQDFELDFISKDKKRINTLASGVMLLDRAGEPSEIFLTAKDITKRKQAEEKYRNLVERMPDVIYSLDSLGRIVSVNEASKVLLGLSPEEIIGRNIMEFVPKEIQSKVNELFGSQISDGKEITAEIVMLDNDGIQHDVEFNSVPIIEAGKIVGIQGIVRDISKRKRMETEIKEYSENLEQLVKKRTRELQVSEEILSQFMKSSPDGFLILDSELNYITINDVGLNVFPEGTRKEDIIGKNIEEIVPDIKETGRFFKYMEVLKTGKPFFVEDVILHPKFDHVHLTLRAFKVGSNLGIIYTDITEQKRMEQLLLKAKRLATIGETAGMVGHDLRNPLQAIVNTIYLANMKVKSLPDEATEKGELKVYLETVDRQVSYMNKIVSDLLDYARPIHPEFTEISIRQLIQSTLLSLEIPETIEVSVAVPKKMKLTVDSTLMRRVFINLITNAMQAMPDGGKLKIKASKKTDEVLISVKDTGVGIREEDLPKLFQPLFTTKSKGQGFGLPVCKRIIDAHGGEITVKSKVGKGSTFTVKIPLGNKKN